MDRPYQIVFPSGPPLDVEDDNVDVEVRFEGGERYAATFFTMRNIQRLREKDRATGECLGGTYFWCIDMIIVDRLEMPVFERVVEDLVRSRGLKSAMSRLRPIDEYGDTDETTDK